MKFTTILFDLDGTLLPMDQEEFTGAYFKLLTKKLVPYGYQPESLINGIWTGTMAMVKNTGEKTNEEVFWECFSEIYGERVFAEKPVFEDFYRVDFQQVKAVCGYSREAVEAVRTLKSKGYRLVLATNPIFPAMATESRIRWAGLEPADFELYTAYENSSYSKPNPEYYRALLEKLQVRPEECLMVGNDAREDAAALKLGISFFLLTDCLINKENRDISEFAQGGFAELLQFIDRMQA